MARKGFFGRLGKKFDQFFAGNDEKEESEFKIESLQKAAKRDLDLANAKAETATTAVAAADMQRKKLAELIAQHEVVNKRALLMEKEGKTDLAKKILAIRLALEDNIKVQTAQYKSMDETAKTLIAQAKKQIKTAHDVSQELPRRVLQDEVNKMMLKSDKLEKSTISAVSNQPSFKALSDKLDLNTAKLMAKSLIEDTDNLGLDEQVDQVVKEVEFTEAYKLLQVNAKAETEVKAIEENPADKARKLLSDPAFGGTLTGYGDSSKVEVEIEDVSEKD